MLRVNFILIGLWATLSVQASAVSKDDSCLTFLGRTYELLGQPKEAVDYFRKARAMHPANHPAKESLKRASENK